MPPGKIRREITPENKPKMVELVTIIYIFKSNYDIITII